MEDILGVVLNEICRDVDYKIARKAVCNLKCTCNEFYKMAGKLGYYSNVKTEPKQIIRSFYVERRKHGLNAVYRINNRGFKMELTLYDRGVVVRRMSLANTLKRKYNGYNTKGRNQIEHTVVNNIGFSNDEMSAFVGLMITEGNEEKACKAFIKTYD